MRFRLGRRVQLVERAVQRPVGDTLVNQVFAAWGDRSLYALARAAGLPLSTVYAVRARGRCQSDVLAKLCRAAGLSLVKEEA